MKQHWPLWTFQEDSVVIHGLSIGLLDTDFNKLRITKTNGIKLEILGMGWGILLAGSSPSMEIDSNFDSSLQLPPSERINGLSLSGMGTDCNCITNGLSLGSMAQYNRKVNGISLTVFSNHSLKHNGIQLAISDWAYMANGLQIGLFTNSVRMSGVQIGGITWSRITKGLQIGIFNKSDNLYGIQIGLWNVNSKRQLPLINWNF